MSYIVPSVLVYQELASSGGVANITPDLEGCIIGPCNNVITYDTTNATTLATSLATISGGAPATALDLSTAPTVYLPSQTVGQVVDPTSLGVYADNATVKTGTSRFAIPSSNFSRLNITGGGSSVNVTLNSKTVTYTTGNFFVNDVFTFVGAGPSGTDLVATITSVNAGTFTISASAKTTASVVANRTGFYNINQNTQTPIVSIGDTIVFTQGTGTQTTKVLSIVQSNNIITTIYTTDLLSSSFTAGTSATVDFYKLYDNLLIPATYGTYTNYTSTNVTIDGSVALAVNPQVSYGALATADIHLTYVARRMDLANQIIDIPDEKTLLATLGPVSDLNPLALGVQLALSNTTSSIKCIAVSNTDDLIGYTAAFQLAENQRLYAFTVLTQRIDILEALQVHVEGLSTPENASWRIGFVNTAIPTVTYPCNSLGGNSPTVPSTGNGLAFNATVNTFVLTDSSANGNFVANGVIPGDLVYVVDSVDSTAAHFRKYTLQVLAVKSNQELEVATPSQGTGPFTSVSYYVYRNMSASQQATVVAGASTTFSSSRIYHVQPDLCGVVINGVTKYLPGYYLCCALVGLTAGLPAQKGLTNVGLAGIVDLAHSNFYFTRAQLNQMAAAGTMLLVQESQGSLPYVRHSLSTDMTVLEYRELQQVKNIDFVSYFFYDILKGFPGRYNITPDTLQTIRATINAGGKLLKGKPLPKIGPPLLDFQIKTLEQDPNNKDQVNVVLPIFIPTVMNYVNLYLIA